MLQILNSQERNQAFLKFLVFFLITVALIVAAIFFDYRMPVRENAILQDKLSTHRQQEHTQQLFVQRMLEVDALFKTLDSSKASPSQILRQIDAKLIGLSELQGSTNTLYGKMNKIIVEGFSELVDLKKASGTTSQQIAALQNELNTCRENLVNEREKVQYLPSR